MRRSWGFLLLAAMLPGQAGAETYLGLSLGHGRAKADAFRFHNPDGGPNAVPATAEDHIPLDGVDRSDGAGAVSLRGGYRPGARPMRFELDYTQRGTVDMSGFANFGTNGNFRQDLRVRNRTLMAMAYFDHKVSKDWAVYAGGGLGWSQNHVTGFQGRNLGGTGFFPAKKNNGAAWSVALGATRPLSERMTLDLGYRYSDLGVADTGSTDASFGNLVPFAMNPRERLESKLRVHEVRVGLNWKF